MCIEAGCKFDNVLAGCRCCVVVAGVPEETVRLSSATGAGLDLPGFVCQNRVCDKPGCYRNQGKWPVGGNLVLDNSGILYPPKPTPLAEGGCNHVEHAYTTCTYQTSAACTQSDLELQKLSAIASLTTKMHKLLQTTKIDELIHTHHIAIEKRNISEGFSRLSITERDVDENADGKSGHREFGNEGDYGPITLLLGTHTYSETKLGGDPAALSNSVVSDVYMETANANE